MWRISVIAAVLWMVVSAAGQQPSLAGRWHLDRDATTQDLKWNKTEEIEIRQSEDDITFDAFDRRGRRFAHDLFVTDWKERPRYVTRIERAYARAKWDKGALEILTRSFLDLEGYRSYSLSERWEISPDGHTLENKTSDGKVIVFYKVREAASERH